MTTPARTRNRRGEGSRLREEIVEAAAELLDETGDPNAITLRSVARRVGIAAPSIYRHFPDQPAIVLAVVRGVFTQLDQQLRDAVTGAGDAPREQLLTLCRSYLAFAEHHPRRYLAVLGGLWIPDLEDASATAEDLADLGSASLQLLADGLRSCVAAGVSSSTDPGADSVALWVGLHGLAHQRVASPNFRWPAGIADRVITALARLDDVPAG